MRCGGQVDAARCATRPSLCRSLQSSQEEELCRRHLMGDVGAVTAIRVASVGEKGHVCAGSQQVG